MRNPYLVAAVLVQEANSTKIDVNELSWKAISCNQKFHYEEF